MRHGVNQASGADEGALATNTWYDHRGNVIKTGAPGGLVTKAVYDGAGRPTAQFTSDGGADPAPGAATAWAAADDVVGDAVFEQVETRYDRNGNAVLATTSQRDHDATALGALTHATARVSFVGNWYDEADRLVTTVNYGNNGNDQAVNATSTGRDINADLSGSPPARDADATNGFDRWLRTDAAYDRAGYQALTQSPRKVGGGSGDGVKTRTYFDALGRTTGVTEAYTGSINSYDQLTDGTVGVDTNRKTVYRYNVPIASLSAAQQATADSSFPWVNVETSMTYNPADPASPRQQSTILHFGVAKDAKNAVNDNRLLKKVRYQKVADDPDDGLPPNSIAANGDEQLFSGYNALGERTEHVDRRNGTTHALSYDALGRQVSDKWTATASFAAGSIDDWANGREIAYDSLGRGVRFTMKSGATDVNDVFRVFDGLGSLTHEYQAHTGAAVTVDSGTGAFTPTAGVPVVRYQYETDYAANRSRQTQTVYPNGRTVSMAYAYDSYPTDGVDEAARTFLNTLNDTVSRVGYLADAEGARLETYDYLGLGRVVVLDRPESRGDLRMSYVDADVDGADGGSGAVIGSPPHGFPAHDDGGSADQYDGPRPLRPRRRPRLGRPRAADLRLRRRRQPAVRPRDHRARRREVEERGLPPAGLQGQGQRARRAADPRRVGRIRQAREPQGVPPRRDEHGRAVREPGRHPGHADAGSADPVPQC